MAFENPHVSSAAFDATEFPDLVRRYRITGVPKTIVNDRVEIVGAYPEPEFVRQVLSSLATGSPGDQPGGGTLGSA